MPVLAAATAATALVGAYSANKASKTQQSASNQGLGLQREQYNNSIGYFEPYRDAGADALAQQRALIGLNGFGEQDAAIGQIQNGAQFQALNRQGQDAILQNASATGGLRGGNTQAALAQFSPQLLQSLIQQQYANLGGLSTLGQNSAAMSASSGQNFANQSGDLLKQRGAAQAGGDLSQGRIFGQLISGGANLYGQSLPGGGRVF